MFSKHFKPLFSKRSSLPFNPDIIEVLGLAAPETEFDLAVIGFLKFWSVEDDFDSRATLSALSDDTKAFLRDRHADMAARAKRVITVRDELDLVRVATKTWYKAIKKRIGTTAKTNPFIRQALERQGPAGEAQMIEFTLKLKKEWKKAWKKMATLEKELLRQSDLKSAGGQEFKRLVFSEQAVSMFEAEMAKFRVIYYTLGQEYLKLVEMDIARLGQGF